MKINYIKLLKFILTLYFINALSYLLKYVGQNNIDNYLLNAFSPVNQVEEILKGNIWSTVIGIIVFLSFNKIAKEKVDYWNNGGSGGTY